MQHKTAIPFIAAIIERVTEGGDLEILIQTRWKPERDPKYSGTFEFVAGVLDKQYENVYETLVQRVLHELE